jgi:hypothetical protein
MGGLTTLSTIWKIVLCLAESYAMAFIGIYALKLFAVVPMMLRERDQTIQHFEGELHKATEITTSGYSQAQIARLIRLKQEADDLVAYNPDSLIQRDKWIKQYDDWRDAVLAVLNDKDVVIFNRPITAGDLTEGRTWGGFDFIHIDKRADLLEKRRRLAKVLERNRD